MKLRNLLAATTLGLGLLPGVHAELLATGSLYGGGSQTQAVCYLFNAGAASVSITINQIVREDGVVQTLTADTCTTLAAGRTCVILANIVNTLSHSCKMVVVPSAADVRGVFDIRQGTSVLQTMPLR
jgi:hypothetical protein